MTESLLNAGNVRLRTIETEDVLFMYRMENDTSMWSMSDTVQPLSRGTVSQFISSVGNDIYVDKQLRLVIELTTPKVRPIGFVDLIEFSPRHLRAEIGIGLLKEYRNHGYAKTALELLENYARDVLFIHQLYAYIAEYNTRGKSLFLNSGYIPSGVLQEWIRTDKGYRNVEIFQKILKKT